MARIFGVFTTMGVKPNAEREDAAASHSTRRCHSALECTPKLRLCDSSRSQNVHDNYPLIARSAKSPNEGDLDAGRADAARFIM